MSNLLGMAWLAGSAVRYRIYAAMGLEGSIVARIFAFAAVSFWMGGLLTFGLLLVIYPTDMIPMGRGAQLVAGLGCLGVIAAIFIFLARGPDTLRVRRFSVSVPPLRYGPGMMSAALVELT